MMDAVSAISLIASLALCVYVSFSDIRTERVPNQVLIIAFAMGIVLDVIQYGFISPNLLLPFALNVIITCAVSLVLFFAHTWAGGDCKLACVLAMLYPASAYLVVGGLDFSLPLAIAIAFILGSLYLLMGFLANLFRRKLSFSLRSAMVSFASFAESYVCALACIGALYLVNAWLVKPFVELDSVALAAIGFCCIWVLSSYGLLNNRKLLVTVLACDVIGSIVLHTVPLGASPVRYVFVLAVVLLRIVVAQDNYRTIPTSDVSQGMVLATGTTMLFSSSRVKGLPGISTEDLRSRLTEEEAASVRRWGTTARGSDEVQIVRKVPFAVFVSLGFIVYFAMWGLTMWRIM